MSRTKLHRDSVKNRLRQYKLVTEKQRYQLERMVGDLIKVSKALYLAEPANPLFDPDNDEGLDEIFIENLKKMNL